MTRRCIADAGFEPSQLSAIALAGAEVELAPIEARERRLARLVAAVGLHVGGWIGSSTTAWIALRLMDVRVDLSTVIAMEAIMYAVRGLGFALPGGLGVQEVDQRPDRPSFRTRSHRRHSSTRRPHAPGHCKWC